MLLSRIHWNVKLIKMNRSGTDKVFVIPLPDSFCLINCSSKAPSS